MESKAPADARNPVVSSYERALQAARAGDYELVATLLDRVERDMAGEADLPDDRTLLISNIQQLSAELRSARDRDDAELAELRRGRRILRRMRGE